MSIDAMKLALAALENPWEAGPEGVADAIIALRAAIEQPRQWQGLTEEEINNSYMFWIVDQQDIIGFGRSIETKLRKKNS